MKLVFSTATRGPARRPGTRGRGGPTYAFVMTFALLKAIGLVMPLRGSEHEEALGMDLVHHGEEAYASGEGAILLRTETGA